MNLRKYIEIIDDFPKKGISFKNITTLLRDRDAFRETIDSMVEKLKDRDIDYIIGPEARGFVLGSAVAYAMNIGFIPVRKKGKLPGNTVEYEYELEYGIDSLEIQEGAVEKDAKVAIIDDLLATGGTVNATAKLVEMMGGKVDTMLFLIELTDLNGREKNGDYNVESLIKYNI
ncbi:MAG: adenine phosphoribosyltransferase [Tissierellia bacterium]|nr:adenine phosphoribosyltransferase [Tissierellia bacterium]